MHDHVWTRELVSALMLSVGWLLRSTANSFEGVVMKIFSSLFGLLLVGVMAVTGLGQVDRDDCESSLFHAKNAVTWRDENKAEVDGLWASGYAYRDGCRYELHECVGDLTAGKFDPSYNGDPAMPPAHAAFVAARQAIEDACIVIWGREYPFTYPLGSASASQSAWDTWANANVTGTLAASNSFYENLINNNDPNPPSGYTWAQIKTALDANEATANSQLAAIAGYKSTAEGIADATLVLCQQIASLRSNINAY